MTFFHTTQPRPDYVLFCVCSSRMSETLSKNSLVQTCDGYRRPLFGLGVYEAQCGGETEQAVLWALEKGYRLVDTAAMYK